MLPSTLHALYASGDDPRDLVKETPVCDACGIALEAGEIDECQLCTNEWWICPECKGRGGDGRCWQHGVGDCNCEQRCSSCDGEGRLLLSNREGLALELAPVETRR
jgi:hypothetical protein